MIVMIGQQLYLLVIELCGLIPSAEMASLRFLESEANCGHIWFTNCQVGESTGCRSLPSFSLSCACHFRSLVVSGD